MSVTNILHNVKLIPKPLLDFGSFYLTLEGPLHNATNFE